MIPTVPQIAAGLSAGSYTSQQASGWIALHITASIAQGRTDDLHAAAAVERLLTGGIRTRSRAPIAVAEGVAA